MNAQDPYWFHKKWGIAENLPIEELQLRTTELENKYVSALTEITRLKDQNIETLNTVTQLMKSIDALETRIDILFGEKNEQL